MSMIPELAKSLGPDGILIALVIVLAGGGFVTYLFWKYTSQTQKQYVDLVQQALRDAGKRAREQHEAYERGRAAERESREERTPPEGIRIHKD